MGTEVGGDFHGGGGAFCVGHLGGDRALPDQVVEFEFVAGQFALHLGWGTERVTCGTDRFVRFLRALLFLGVHPWGAGDVFGPIEFGNLLAGGGDGLGGQGRGVRTHICDVPVFVQRLGNAHGLAGAHAEFAAGFLLQG